MLRFSIAGVLPAAFGECDFLVKVLVSISKQILIKALRTETSEKCAVPGSVPKVICFYEQHNCSFAPAALWGTELSWGEGHCHWFWQTLTPNFPSLWPTSKLLMFLPACPVPMASQNPSAVLSQPWSPVEKSAIGFIQLPLGSFLPIQSLRLLWHWLNGRFMGGN